MNKYLKPSIHYLENLLVKGKINLQQQQLESLWKYHKLLRRHNKDHDLTRLIKFETIVSKHYIDCMTVPKLVELTGSVLDIGTGAGFPGIPIKILQPKLDITLAEHRPRRITFLNLVIKELNLQKIKTYNHKVIRESVINDGESFDIVITRALESIPQTLYRVEKNLKNNGQVIFMKGPNCSDEIREAKLTSLNFKLEKNIHYSISKLDKRRLVVFRLSS